MSGALAGHRAVVTGSSNGIGRAVAARPILVNGNVGVVVAPRGHLMMVLNFVIQSGNVIAIEAFTEPERVAALELVVLDT